MDYHMERAADVAFDTELLESGRVYYRTPGGQLIRVCNVRAEVLFNRMTGMYQVWYGNDWDDIEIGATAHRVVDGDHGLHISSGEATSDTTTEDDEAIARRLLADDTHIPVLLSVADAFRVCLMLSMAIKQEDASLEMITAAHAVCMSLIDDIIERHPDAERVLRDV